MPDLEGSLSKILIGVFTVWIMYIHTRGVGAASDTNFQYHPKLRGYPTMMGIWRLVTVIYQCREMIASYRSSSAVNPHAEITLCPRGCLIPLSLGFFYIVLYSGVLFSALLFSSHKTEQQLMSAMCFLFHHLPCHAPTGVNTS